MLAAASLGFRRLTALSAGACVGLVLAGCGQKITAKDLPLDKSLAKQSLTAALDAWKAGGQPSALKDRQPSIIVSDVTWKSGAKLADYKVLSERDGGANLIVQVELTLEKEGQQTTRKAEYTIGTSPVIVVTAKDEED